MAGKTVGSFGKRFQTVKWSRSFCLFPTTTIRKNRMAQYDSVDYWDDRYSTDQEPFEWFQRYSGIRHFLTPRYLTFSKQNVLIAGCGNSELGEEMISDGFTSITNVDSSSVVINQMKQKYSDDWQKTLRRERNKGEDDADTKSPNAKTVDPTSSPNRLKQSPIRGRITPKKEADKPITNKMKFECCDLTKTLPFNDKSFDLILCKGTLDAILCSKNALDKVQSMMTECHRVLDDQHGVMVVISYGDPENRLKCFDTSLWREVKTYTVPKPLVPGVSDKVGACVNLLHVFVLKSSYLCIA